MSTTGDKWSEALREAKAYLGVLRGGGFCYAEGKFERDPGRRRAPATAKKQPQANKPAAGAVSSEAREALKAALSDPFARATASARPASRPVSATTPPARAPQPASARMAGAAPSHPPVGKPKLVTLRDRAEGVKKIAAIEDLEQLHRLIQGCHMCQLASGRTLAVPGEGNPQTELMFVGEGPGYNEDVQGRPFVGRAGELLAKMIEDLGLRREDVFITNVIKCRPPGNRDPSPDEIKACSPFLKRQLELIRPRVICALGRIAILGLLNDTTPITRMRGVWRQFQGIPLMPTFHPAYLLRNPSESQRAMHDLRAVMAKIAELKKGA
ncbi:uracil-DNA glycosylase [Candidatus Sumerlaeota bacterium]|nr:uracil-DNA glycosylase [Candidatus Sumerlaeota bacterium]